MKWACYECDKKFKTSVQLQLHVAQHENDDYQEDSDDDPTLTETSMGRTTKRKLPASRFPLAKKKRLKGNKKIKDIMASSDDSAGKFQSWKKKKTNLYLNK